MILTKNSSLLMLNSTIKIRISLQSNDIICNQNPILIWVKKNELGRKLPS